MEVIAMTINEVKKKERKKMNQNWKKKEVRMMSLSADDIILHIKNPKDATRKPLVAVQLLSHA